MGFLKYIHACSIGKIGKSDLKLMISGSISKYPDLIDGFDDFVKHCEDIAFDNQLESIQKIREKDSDTIMRENSNPSVFGKADPDKVSIQEVEIRAEHVEELVDGIKEKKIKLEGPFKVEDHLSVLNLRCIERLYDERGYEMLGGLNRNPKVALPLILSRLKQRVEELVEIRSDLNKDWAQVYGRTGNGYTGVVEKSGSTGKSDGSNASRKKDGEYSDARGGKNNQVKNGSKDLKIDMAKKAAATQGSGSRFDILIDELDERVPETDISRLSKDTDTTIQKGKAVLLEITNQSNKHKENLNRIPS
ncbi:hypothetical protein LWI29_029201 [Acer saccharum]|uniref:Uncharacterized protein n=1 Tax=Acer saccharum TaxID=4024 RepID=A0AA39S7J3_ACESA|nr:hypothetical protein LWI29_029201 [Acer saccharum]